MKAGRDRAPRPPRPEATTSHGLASTTRAMHLGLWALLALAALGGLRALVAPAARAAPPAPKPPAPTVGAEGFAELYVAAFVAAGQGTEDSLRPYFPQTVELRDVRPGALYVARTATVEARSVGERYWAVTVAAEVLSSGADGYRPLGTRFYQVGVAGSADGGLVATSLPAQVPAPPGAKPPPLEAGSLEDPRPDDAVSEAVTRFAQAFLTGAGELVRYVAPDANLRPVQPAPFTSVRLTRIGARDMPGPDKAQQVVAELRATDSAGRVEFLQYALELAQRAGRWEVRALLPAPPLSRPAATTSTTADASPATAPSPTPTSTTTALAATTSSSSTTSTRPAQTARATQ